MMKWLATACLALVFAILSFNAFIHNNLAQQRSANRIIGLLTDVYGWLVGVIGYMPTGVLFAVCAVGIVVVAAVDGRKPQAAPTQTD